MEGWMNIVHIFPSRLNIIDIARLVYYSKPAMGKAKKRENAKTMTESHSQGSGGAMHHSHDHEDDCQEAAKQRARDELLSSEIACFIFLINKEEEETSLRLPVWLVETRFKKNWVFYYSSSISSNFLWNKGTTKPNNLKKLSALKGDVNALSDNHATLRFLCFWTR